MPRNQRSTMKHLTLLIILAAVFLAACTGGTTTNEADQELSTSDEMEDMNDDMEESDMNDMKNHELSDTMGCDDGQINEDGICLFEDKEPLADHSIFGTVENDIRSEEINLGYYVRPDDDEIYPGVLLIHEWWGLNDNIKKMADLLADEGYAVLAVDLYDGQVTQDPAVARELVTAARADPDKAVMQMQTAAAYLRSEAGVQTLGSMGWCFGGGQSLNLATSGTPVDATVIYYGTLTDDEELLSNFDQPVLGIFGSEDSSIPVETVEAFKAGLNNVGIENEIHIYEGVGHAFANPSGSNYAAEESYDAWQKTLTFLETNLKG